MPSSPPVTWLLSVTESSVVLPLIAGKPHEYRAYILNYGHIERFEPSSANKMTMQPSPTRSG